MQGFGFLEETDKKVIIKDFAAQHPKFDGFDVLSRFDTWLYSSLALKATDFFGEKYVSMFYAFAKDEKHNLEEDLALHNSKKGHPCLRELLQFGLIWNWYGYSDYLVFDGYDYRELKDEEWQSFFREFKIEEYKQLIDSHIKGCSLCYCIVASYVSSRHLNKTEWDALNKVMHNILDQLVLPEKLKEGTRDEAVNNGNSVRANRKKMCRSCGEPGHNRRTCVKAPLPQN
jgi:hypothetical protein